ncbi:MAG: glycosyltransferase family 8 protein [Methanosarcinaceae archaeon]|nr:glycosyltransferase family 8 protein [Methanosarcinaceae archaeon]
MDILVTLDSNYIHPLKVMLKSLFFNNPKNIFTIHLMHSSITDEEIEDLKDFISIHGNESKLNVIYLDDDCFSDAPVNQYYTKEMYYRLLAFKFLPKDLEKILYIDPDILVLNPVDELYNMDISNYLYAAAPRSLIGSREVNKLRLLPHDIDAYYNSGVLLMNLKLQREMVDEKSIYDFVDKNSLFFVLPDQDVLNAMYSKQIKSIDDRLYNYDARLFNYYKTIDSKWDMDYVINNTVIIHFCGKKKPWKKNYNGRFHALYKHYEKQAFS